MKKKLIILSLVMFVVIFAFGEEHRQKSLQEIYKTGKVYLSPITIINNESLPENLSMKYIVDLAVNEEGEVFAADIRANHIFAFDSSGKFKKAFGQKGEGPGDLYLPSQVVYQKGRLIVWETGNMRFSIFAGTGKFIKIIKPEKPTPVFKMEGLPGGEVIVYYPGRDKDPQEGLIYIYHKNLKTGALFYKHPIFMFERLRKPIKIDVIQPFTPSVVFDVSGDGNIIVGISNKYKFEVYNKERQILSSFEHEYTPVKVTEKDKKEWFSHIRVSGAKAGDVPAFYKKATGFPKYKPHFHDILSDPEGNILVFLNTSGEKEYIDTFTPRYEFINRVEIIKGEIKFHPNSAIAAGDGCFWSVGRDKAGERSIIKYIILRDYSKR